MGLHRMREGAAGKRIRVPYAAVLDEYPVVDPAGRRPQRFATLRGNLVALFHLDGEHGSLHRADDRVTARGVVGGRPALAPPNRQLAVPCLGYEQLDLEAASVELDERGAGGELLPRRGRL